MRIAHVNDIAHVASVLAGGQQARGHVVEVIDPAKPGASLPYPWKVATLPLRAAPLAVAAWRLRRTPFDVVHVHYATHAAMALVSGRPAIVHCHGSDVRGVDPRSFRGRYLRATLAHAGAVLYSTVDLAEWVRPLRPDAAYLPNPIDVNAFQPAARPAERDVLLGVRLDPIKGAGVAIDAIRRLREERPATSITVIADGLLAADALSAAGPGALVVPRQPHDAMPDLLRRHRVAVGQFRLGLPGQFELEAMASGVPVVADLRYGGSYDPAPPIVQAADPASAARALATLLDDEPGRASVGEASRAWIHRFHAVDGVVARLDAVYLEIVAARAGRRITR